MIDQIDRDLTHRLMRQGRATWADLAVELGLTAPAIAQRVRRLEDRGVIRHFAAVVDPRSVAPVAAFVAVHPADNGDQEEMRQRLAELDEVQECHFVGGTDDHLLKVRTTSLAALEEILRLLLPAAGVTVGRVQVVLSSVKETPVVPMETDQQDKEIR